MEKLKNQNSLKMKLQLNLRKSQNKRNLENLQERRQQTLNIHCLLFLQLLLLGLFQPKKKNNTAGNIYLWERATTEEVVEVGTQQKQCSC